MTQCNTISIGISACLAGEPVRYDGSHIDVTDLSEYLSSLFTLVPICPEVAIGMGVPRPPIQLVGEPAIAHAMGVQNRSMDVTEKLSDFAKVALKNGPALDGFVVKARSPSCGLDTTPVYNHLNEQIGTGSGVFTRTLHNTYPTMPLIDESCINNRDSLELFVLRVCVYSVSRWPAQSERDTQTIVAEYHQKLSDKAGKLLAQLRGPSTTLINKECVNDLVRLLNSA